MRVVFGGSFNPPTIAHKEIIRKWTNSIGKKGARYMNISLGIPGSKKSINK